MIDMLGMRDSEDQKSLSFNFLGTAVLKCVDIHSWRLMCSNSCLLGDAQRTGGAYTLSCIEVFTHMIIAHAG